MWEWVVSCVNVWGRCWRAGCLCMSSFQVCRDTPRFKCWEASFGCFWSYIDLIERHYFQLCLNSNPGTQTLYILGFPFFNGPFWIAKNIDIASFACVLPIHFKMCIQWRDGWCAVRTSNMLLIALLFTLFSFFVKECMIIQVHSKKPVNTQFLPDVNVLPLREWVM